MRFEFRKRVIWCVGAELAAPLYTVDLEFMVEPRVAIREHLQVTFWESAKVRSEIAEDVFPKDENLERSFRHCECGISEYPPPRVKRLNRLNAPAIRAFKMFSFIGLFRGGRDAKLIVATVVTNRCRIRRL